MSDLDDYARFLLAHAAALSAVEAHLRPHTDLPAWRQRTALLASDLGELGLAMPSALPFELPNEEAQRWGALYVVEGSRFGGSVLLKRTLECAPKAFLSAGHLHGEWPSLLHAIEARSHAMGPTWIRSAIEGARACFELYRVSATAKQLAFTIEPGNQLPPAQRAVRVGGKGPERK